MKNKTFQTKDKLKYDMAMNVLKWIKFVMYKKRRPFKSSNKTLMRSTGYNLANISKILLTLEHEGFIVRKIFRQKISNKNSKHPLITNRFIYIVSELGVDVLARQALYILNKSKKKVFKPTYISNRIFCTPIQAQQALMYINEKQWASLESTLIGKKWGANYFQFKLNDILQPEQSLPMIGQFFAPLPIPPTSYKEAFENFIRDESQFYPRTCEDVVNGIGCSLAMAKILMRPYKRTFLDGSPSRYNFDELKE